MLEAEKWVQTEREEQETEHEVRAFQCFGFCPGKAFGAEDPAGKDIDDAEMAALAAAVAVSGGGGTVLVHQVGGGKLAVDVSLEPRRGVWDGRLCWDFRLCCKCFHLPFCVSAGHDRLVTWVAQQETLESPDAGCRCSENYALNGGCLLRCGEDGLVACDCLRYEIAWLRCEG